MPKHRLSRRAALAQAMSTEILLNASTHGTTTSPNTA